MTDPETTELAVLDAVLAGKAVPPEHAELAELALLLREERPEPTPDFSAQLDRRAAAGFPRRPRRRLRISWAALAPAGGLVATAALIVALVVAAPRDGDDAAGGGAGQSATSAMQEEDAAGAGRLAPAARDPRSDARADREVERSASLTLGAPRRELDAMAGAVSGVATELGGFVASSRVSSADGGRMDLRVPSRRLDAAIERLSELGSVRSLSRESLDITSAVVSARDRLQDARAERRGLLRQLEEATTLQETESLRERLRIVSREIAAARARVERVENRARFADVAVRLVPDRGEPADEGAVWTPADAFRDALRVLEVMAGVALIGLAVLLPLALAWALAWLARRGLARRRRERALDIA